MSDIDLDAELLQLAGDPDTAPATASDGAVDTQKAPSPSPSATPPTQLLTQLVDDKSPPSSQPPSEVAQQRPPTVIRGAGRKRRKDDSTDEGEASSPAASNDSLGSGAMSESVSGEEADGDQEDDVVDTSFLVEGKYLDQKDKEEILALPEFRREQILAERQEKALKEKQDAHLALLLKRQQQEEAKKVDKKKRKADTADLDEGPRKAARARTKQSDAVDEFKKKREADLKERETGVSRHKPLSPDSKGSKGSQGSKGSDIDADGESDVQLADERPKARDETTPDLRDFQRVRIGRSNFAQICFYPNFEGTVLGCFTRACVGPNPETGHQEYRMAQIKGLETGKPYQMETANGRFFWVDMYCRLAYGQLEKTWPFTACSDSEFSEAEFNRYRIVCGNEGQRLPTRVQLTKTLDGIHALLNRKWTDLEIAEKLKKQKRLSHLGIGPAASSNAAPPPEKKKMPVGAGLHQLNIANRKKNSEDVRKALIAERKASAANRERVKQRELAKRAKLAQQAAGEDVSQVGSDVSGTATPGVGSSVATPKRSGTPLTAPRQEKKGLPTLKRYINEDEIIGAMDLSIDIDI